MHIKEASHERQAALKIRLLSGWASAPRRPFTQINIFYLLLKTHTHTNNSHVPEYLNYYQGMLEHY